MNKILRKGVFYFCFAMSDQYFDISKFKKVANSEKSWCDANFQVITGSAWSNAYESVTKNLK